MTSEFCEPDDVEARAELIQLRTDVYDAFAKGLGRPVQQRDGRLQWWGARNEERFVLRFGAQKPNWRGERAVGLGINSGEAAQRELIERVVTGGEELWGPNAPAIWRLVVSIADREAEIVAPWVAEVARIRIEGVGPVPEPPVDFGTVDLGQLIQDPEMSGDWQLWSAAWRWAGMKRDPLQRGE